MPQTTKQTDERIQEQIQEQGQKSYLKKEPEGCYLITDHPFMDEESELSFRMLTENRVRGMLNAQMRSFNGEKQIYYEITGMQSLESLSRQRPLTGNDLSGLFSALYGLTQKLPEYYLDPQRVILSPDKIYLDERSFRFCYSFDKESSLEDFAKALIGMIDNSDEAAVAAAYRFYRLCGQTQAGLRYVTGQLISQDTDVSEDCLDDNLKNAADHEPYRVSIRKQSEESEKDRAGADTIQGKMCKDEGSAGGGGGEKTEKKTADPVALIIFLLLLLLGVFIFVYPSVTAGLPDPSGILKSPAHIFGIIFAVSGLAGIIFTIKRKG